jgi:hypothetical protein
MQESTPRQRVIRLLATGLAAAAVAGVTIITAAVTGSNEPVAAGSSEPAVAGSSEPAGAPNSTPTPQVIPAPAREKRAGTVTTKAPKATKSSRTSASRSAHSPPVVRSSSPITCTSRRGAPSGP